MPRLARVLLLALVLAPTLLRALPAAEGRECARAGRGLPPRTWLGCAADGGPPRDLSGEERLLLGQPLDLNAASARELAFVPGVTRALAAEIEAERQRGGPFGTVDELIRVRGIGPVRLARARPFLRVAAPVGVAVGTE
jgi:competence protein ComEA